MAKWFIEIDSYWENSRSTFFGPYETKDVAMAAVDHENGPAWIRQSVRYLRNGVRAELHNTTSARKAGMRKDENLIPAQEKLPGTLEALREVEDLYLYI